MLRLTTIAILVGTGSAAAQVAVPVLNVRDAQRCAAALEIMKSEGRFSGGNLRADQYLAEHPLPPAMDLAYSADLSEGLSRDNRAADFVYTTRYGGSKSACAFFLSDDGLRHYILGAWMIISWGHFDKAGKYHSPPD